MLYTARGIADIELVDEAAVAAKYGIPGRAYADFAVLRGDPSDGLPGVAGVGAKTAAALINEFGDLAGIRAAVARTVVPKPPLTAAVLKKMHAAAAYLDAAPVVVAVAKRPSTCRRSRARSPASPADPAALAGAGRGARPGVVAQAAGRGARLAGGRAGLSRLRARSRCRRRSVSSVIAMLQGDRSRRRRSCPCTRRWRPSATFMSSAQSRSMATPSRCSNWAATSRSTAAGSSTVELQATAPGRRRRRSRSEQRRR